jgi:spore germination cell wall hydrolase CwlJ-like protein
MIIDLPPVQVVCIAQAIYAEARGESDLGKRAVAHVILNRSKKRKLTPCQVIREPGQFNFNHKAKYKGRDWDKAWQIANYSGLDPSGGASYFKVTNVRVSWGKKLTTVIGNHSFYK